MAGAAVEEEEVIKITAKEIITINAEAINKASITLKTNRVTIKDTTKVIVSIAKVKTNSHTHRTTHIKTVTIMEKGNLDLAIRTLAFVTPRIILETVDNKVTLKSLTKY